MTDSYWDRDLDFMGSMESLRPDHVTLKISKSPSPGSGDESSRPWEPGVPDGQASQMETHVQPPRAGLEGAGDDKPGGGSTPGSYVLDGVIGKGAFGEVWLAVQSSLRRTVALKRVRRDDDGRSVFRTKDAEQLVSASFREEALLTARLDHPNIVPVHDLLEDENGLPMMAMKLVEGENWGARLAADWAARKPLSDILQSHIPVLLVAARAIAFAHGRGVIHRDIKPAQVVIGDFGEVFVTDWGLAILLSEEALREHSPGPLLAGMESDWVAEDLASTDAGATLRGGMAGNRGEDPGLSSKASPSLVRLTSLAGHVQSQMSASSPAGTPAYMAPEQTERSAARTGPWTDVFQLGACLYHVMTGNPPYGQGNARLTMMEASRGRWKPLEEVCPGVSLPRELAALVEEAMEPDCQKRVLTARSFAERLESWLQGVHRRQEGMDLVQGVQRALSEYQSYGDLLAALNRLERAEGLLAESDRPMALPIREELAMNLVRRATEQGDLGLAEDFLPWMGVADQGRWRDRIREARSAELKRHKLGRLLAAGIVVLLMVTLLAAGVLHSATGQGAEYSRLAGRLIELRGEILLADEQLTMSTRMAAATGEPRWKERYDQLVPRLDGALSQARDLASPEQTAMIDATAAANNRLIALETQAFDLASQGRQTEAAAVLDSQAYTTDKVAYSEALDRFLDHVLRTLQTRGAEARQRVVLAEMVVTGAAVGLAMLLGLAAMLVRTRREKEVRGAEL